MLKLLLGDPNTRKLKRYQPIVEEINFLEEEISRLTDDELLFLAHHQLIEKFLLLENLSLPLLVDSALTFVYLGHPTKVLA